MTNLSGQICYYGKTGLDHHSWIKLTSLDDSNHGEVILDNTTVFIGPHPADLPIDLVTKLCVKFFGRKLLLGIRNQDTTQNCGPCLTV